MADIFISYANEDRVSAAQLARTLETAGWRGGWDRRIPAGRTWRVVLEDALRDMRCMVVSGRKIRCKAHGSPKRRRKRADWAR
jgi:hypothetical protein